MKYSILQFPQEKARASAGAAVKSKQEKTDKN